MKHKPVKLEQIELFAALKSGDTKRVLEAVRSFGAAARAEIDESLQKRLANLRASRRRRGRMEPD